MAKIKPFNAVRSVRDKAHLVCSKSIQMYHPSDLQSILKKNPYSFLNIIHPELPIDQASEKNTYIPKFKCIKQKYDAFKNKGILIQDDSPAFYIYKQIKNNHEFLGVIGTADIENHTNNVIKKHEGTIPKRECIFVDYLETSGFNAEPVLLAHPQNPELDQTLYEIVKNTPEYSFETEDNIKHEIWITTHAESSKIESIFNNINTLYIADGHHRSAAMARLLSKTDNTNKNRFNNGLLSLLICENKLKILPFNRICKSLNGLSEEDFILQLSKYFTVVPLGERSEPAQQHHIHMYLNKQWHKLIVKSEVLEQQKCPVGSIDAEMLTQYILEPILGIKDLKLDGNISFINGEEGLEEIEKRINHDDYKVGFSLYPVTMNQLKSVADNDSIMPVKSTWIEPKLRTGLIIHQIDG